jgi:hypothetical protein
MDASRSSYQHYAHRSDMVGAHRVLDIVMAQLPAAGTSTSILA